VENIHFTIHFTINVRWSEAEPFNVRSWS
jgi:hypothetical protein